MTTPMTANILAFIFGACIGSFLNVCIYRIPTGLSIVHPGSSCPRCKTMIPFYDNIPILSYLMLMGKCRNCRAPIAIRYPFVELLGGLSALAVPNVTWRASAIGIVAGGGSLFTVAWVYQLMTGREGMGGGDIKLLAMIGAMIGWRGILFTLFAASAIGTIVGLLAMARSGKGMRLAIPFGPFLAMGAIIYLFFGERLISWYFNFLR